MSTVSIDKRWYQADHAVIERMDEIDKERTYFKQLAAERAVSLSHAIERATTAEREHDEASAELERVKAERDAALVKIKVLFNVAHDAVGHVSAANYPERESLAHKRIDDCYDGKP